MASLVTISQRNYCRENIPVIATGKGDCRLPFDDFDNFSYEGMDITDPFRVNDVFEKMCAGYGYSCSGTQQGG